MESPTMVKPHIIMQPVDFSDVKIVHKYAEVHREVK